ncbi:MAG: O-antigen ligase family protein [Cyanobacteria bacterium J06638_22]
METRTGPFPSLQLGLRGSLVALPYASYLGFLGVLIVTVAARIRAKQAALSPRIRWMLLGITGLMVLSCAFANSRPEAFLQLGNFLPYFFFFAVVPLIFTRIEDWQQVATDLVITIIPINLASVGHYWLRSPFLPAPWQQIPWIDAIRLAPHRGRAMVTFDHPNAFASYLVMILGLGLGLMVSELSQSQKLQHDLTPWWKSRLFAVALGTGSCLLGIFTSGSRNGLLVALIQLGAVVLMMLARANLKLVIGSLAGMGLVVGSAAVFGIGGRSLTPGDWTDDPRVATWAIALELIRDRPWLGWGLGNFKLLFPARTFDPVNYPKMFHPHNIWLMLATEAGLILTLLTTLFVGYLCYRAMRLWLSRQLSPAANGALLAYLLGFLGCLLYALFDVTLYDGRVHLLNWLMLAGLYGFGEQWKPHPTSPPPDKDIDISPEP